jgi:nucleotide-binding universal stress UspA family protein
MPRSILVGLDGSAYGNAAVELGIEWAKQFNLLVVGLGIIDEPSIMQPEPVSLGGTAFKKDRSEAMLAEARHKVEALLEAFALRCADAGVASKLLEDVGAPADRIMLEAQRYDLIMLGRQTYFRFETQPSPDDTLREVVKNSPRPVIAVPDVYRRGKSVVVAYDGSLQAARTLQAYCGLGLGAFQPLHIVSVHADHLQAARCADRAIDFLGHHNLRAQPHPIASSEAPAQVVLKQLDALDASLLVMGAYGEPTLTEFIFGSMTRTILKEASTPVFLYH